MRHPETHLVRPRNDCAANERICVYCRSSYGGTHEPGCVIRHRTVVVRAIIEYVIDVPEHWAEENILFHRNEGSWCSDNMLDELAAETSKDGSRDCLCSKTTFEYVREATAEDEATWSGSVLSHADGSAASVAN